ncbi:hypothetical protein IQ225_17050, partial [Synechocystis salina LEGE 06155]|nr:hypothetical protein [Synechocystis salina LEGE 06155]
MTYSSLSAPLLVNNPNHSSFGQKKFQPTNRHNPCPVCAKTNGNCRLIADEGVLCMTFPDGDGHPDYRYIKPSGDRLWGLHYPRKDDDFDREAWERRKTEQEARSREIERQRQEKCLTPGQRHQEYQCLLAELSLNNQDRQNLLQRGFTEAEIKAGDYASVEQFQRLEGKYHVNLPGIGRYGN